MATSSIFHNIVIKKKKAAKRFVKALEEAEWVAMKKKTPVDEISYLVSLIIDINRSLEISTNPFYIDRYNWEKSVLQKCIKLISEADQ